MTLKKRKNSHSEILTKQGLPTKKALKLKAEKVLARAKEKKDKPIFLKKGTCEKSSEFEKQRELNKQKYGLEQDE